MRFEPSQITLKPFLFLPWGRIPYSLKIDGAQLTKIVQRGGCFTQPGGWHLIGEKLAVFAQGDVAQSHEAGIFSEIQDRSRFAPGVPDGEEPHRPLTLLLQVDGL